MTCHQLAIEAQDSSSSMMWSGWANIFPRGSRWFSRPKHVQIIVCTYSTASLSQRPEGLCSIPVYIKIKTAASWTALHCIYCKTAAVESTLRPSTVPVPYASYTFDNAAHPGSKFEQQVLELFWANPAETCFDVYFREWVICGVLSSRPASIRVQRLQRVNRTVLQSSPMAVTRDFSLILIISVVFRVSAGFHDSCSFPSTA